MAKYLRSELEGMSRIMLRRVAKSEGVSSEEAANMEFDEMIDDILHRTGGPIPEMPGSVDYSFLLRLGVEEEVLGEMSMEELEYQSALYEGLPSLKQNKVYELLEAGGKDIRWCVEYFDLKERLRLQSESLNLVCSNGEVYMWVKIAPTTKLSTYQVLSDALQETVPAMLLPPAPSINRVRVTESEIQVYGLLNSEWLSARDLVKKIPELTDRKIYSAAASLCHKDLVERDYVKGRVHYRRKEGD